MFDNMENLTIVSSLHKSNKLYNKIENRSTHSFIIRISGSVEYTFPHKKITVNAGEAIFLPQGICYEYHTASSTPSNYTSINFLANIKNGEPKSYTLNDFYGTEYICRHFSDHWNFGTPSEKFECISMFYSLLSYVTAIENSDYGEKRKFEIIEPAVAFLKKHIYDPDLKIDTLHKLCGISNTYFRKIFVSRFNMTPQSYIISKRMAHAKSTIECGDFSTVGEVALSSGFNDALYFGKLFKKLYGVSPSEFSKY